MPDTFDDFRRSGNRIQEESDRAHDLMANAAERPESLNDFLLHQLAEMDIDDEMNALRSESSRVLMPGTVVTSSSRLPIFCP